jgi:hypothetical protein
MWRVWSLGLVALVVLSWVLNPARLSVAQAITEAAAVFLSYAVGMLDGMADEAKKNERGPKP